MTNANRKPSLQEIGQRAHEIWAARGDKPGSALADWLEAERQLNAEAERKSGDGKTSAADTKGCAVSFIMEERDELGGICDNLQPDPKEEYVQPESEKEDGGES